MTEEQKHLCALIDGHAAAMKAQVVDPKVKLQYLSDGRWQTGNDFSLWNDYGPRAICWTRLAPVPRLIPLDQSDFLGVNRVTHLRRNDATYIVTRITPDFIGIGGGAASYGYSELYHHGDWECSRDFGASFGPCSKVEASK